MTSNLRKEPSRPMRQALMAMIRTVGTLRATRCAGSVEKALVAEILRQLDGLEALPNNFPAALVASGNTALRDRAILAQSTSGKHARYQSIVLGASDWSRLLDQGPEAMLAVLDTDEPRPVVSAENGSLPALVWAVHHPGDPDGERLLDILARKDAKAHHILHPRFEGLFFVESRAEVAAAFLTTWAEHHKPSAKMLGQNWAGKGDVFIVMALHLAGLALSDMAYAGRKLHPAVAPVFEDHSAHATLARAKHAPNLAGLIHNRVAFTKWAKALLVARNAPPAKG